MRLILKCVNLYNIYNIYIYIYETGTRFAAACPYRDSGIPSRVSGNSEASPFRNICRETRVDSEPILSRRAHKPTRTHPPPRIPAPGGDRLKSGALESPDFTRSASGRPTGPYASAALLGVFPRVYRIGRPSEKTTPA